ncbi:MAG: YebC/PmpR family DNA-binding transcriptional regulator [Bacilli bacterium]|jgi:YebC/PmpR family DNA-binding regulatory protein
MSRHWNNIKYAKAAKDKNRSKIYSKFGLEIYVAAKGEPDPEINRKLADVIAKAKTYNVPRDIIERAIEKAKGGNEENYSEVRYEGYGPSGAAVIVDCLTDNVNRTVSVVRAAFTKYGGSLGVSGSVAYMFESIAVVSATGITEEQVLEALIEHDVEAKDIEVEGEEVIVTADSTDFNKVQEVFKSLGVVEFSTCEITMEPQTTMTLSEEDLVKFERLIDALNESEDVQNIYHNVEM